jgi:hypothetical protein
MSNVPLPLTYRDLVCDTDLDPFANETGSDLENLIQDLTHLLVENLGSNPDDPLRGIGIANYLSGTTDVLPALCGTIEDQFNRDNRVSGCSATIAQQPDKTWLLSITIQVGTQVLPLQYSWSTPEGLALLSRLGD